MKSSFEMHKPGMLQRIGALIGRDLRACFADGLQGPALLCFFPLATVAAPLGLAESQSPGPGAILVPFVLTLLLSIHRHMRLDYDHGIYGWLLAGGISPSLLFLSKLISHLIAIDIPLFFCALLLAPLFGIHPDSLMALGICLALSLPAMACLCVAFGALACLVAEAALLAAMLSLPLFFPFLIFIGAVLAEAPAQESLGMPFFWLCAYSFFLLATVPFFACWAIDELG